MESVLVLFDLFYLLEGVSLLMYNIVSSYNLLTAVLDTNTVRGHTNEKTPSDYGIFLRTAEWTVFPMLAFDKACMN